MKEHKNERHEVPAMVLGWSPPSGSPSEAR